MPPAGLEPATRGLRARDGADALEREAPGAAHLAAVVRVQSAREASASARRLGGTVLLEPNAALLDSRVAVVADPTGAAIGLLEWDEAEAPPRP